MQDIRIDNEKQANPSASAATAASSNTTEAQRRRQRHLTCYKCNKPDSKAVICSRDGPTRGGYCVPCFERYIGEFFRSGFFRHCGMMPFLQERDKSLLASMLEETPTNNNLRPEQITCSSTKIIVAVSGSYNSMALLIQLANLNKEISDKYLMICQNGKKLPPQGKNILIRPMELVVVHLTRFDHSSSSSASSCDDASSSSSSAEDAEAFRVEEERIKSISSVVSKLGNGNLKVLFKSVAEVNNNNQSQLVQKCFLSTANPHSQGNKSMPLSVREDLYRCLIRNGLLNVAVQENAQVVTLAQSATSSSWAAINDVTRGRGAGLFEANGYFCEVDVASSSSTSGENITKNKNIKFIRPLVGTAARELTLFCTILNKNKDFASEIQNCTVENPTSFSPSIPSIDRTLEDFVLNLTKSFASTSFNVAKTIEKVNAINFMRRIEGREEAFMMAGGAGGNAGSNQEEQEAILNETKKWKNCKLCLFSKVFDEDEQEEGDLKDTKNKNDDDDVAQVSKKNNSTNNNKICHGCQDSIISEMESLARNLPVAAAKQQSQNFLEMVQSYIKVL